jgi:hypothetical protein
LSDLGGVTGQVESAGSRYALLSPVHMQIFFAGEHTEPGCNPCMQVQAPTVHLLNPKTLNTLKKKVLGF